MVLQKKYLQTHELFICCWGQKVTELSFIFFYLYLTVP